MLPLFTGLACRLDTWSRGDGGRQAFHGRARVGAGRGDPHGYPIIQHFRRRLRNTAVLS